MEAYQFPNVERELITLIRSQMRVDAGVDIPADRPAEYVQVNRAGGDARFIDDRPMVTFYVWGPSWSAAHDLGALVRRRVMSVLRIASLPVYRITEIGGLARAPDQPDGSPRYQFTVQYKLRGSTAPE